MITLIMCIMYIKLWKGNRNNKKKIEYKLALPLISYISVTVVQNRHVSIVLVVS